MVTKKLIVEMGTCSRCGELWSRCRCGAHTPPAVSVTDGGDEPEPAPLVEWVQWRSSRGELSLYHVRVTSSGWLLCGRKAPTDPPPAADSFPPVEQKCAVCLGKLAS